MYHDRGPPRFERRRSIHSRNFSADLGVIPTGQRRRSLSFSWILYGHQKVTSSSITTTKPLERLQSANVDFTYQALEDNTKFIRLVHLLPAAGLDDRIVCHLESVRISGRHEFEALSYCWGDERSLSPISLNNQEHFVTSNLESALRHLRLPDKERILWIDSMSINQADVPEKSVQVQQMGAIFSAASKVVIWLGRAHEEEDPWDIEVNDSLLQDALILARELRIAYETFWCDDPFRWAKYLDEQTDQLKLAPAGDSSRAGQVTAVIINLLGRAWFSRMWVIQEAHIHFRAPDVVIGFFTAQLVDFTYTAHYLALMEDFRMKTFGQPTSDYLFNPFQMQDIRFCLAHPDYQALSSPAQLLILLSMTSASFSSSECRDRIFALLGLVDGHNGRQSILPDYNKTFAATIVETAKYILAGTKSFALLHLANPKAADSPSWAPQWDQPVIFARHETRFDDYLSCLTTFPGQDLFEFSFDESGRVLHASGVFVGDIIKAHGMPPLETSQNETYRYVRNVGILRDFEDMLKSDVAFNGCLDLSSDSKSTVLAHVFEGHRFSWTWEGDVERYDALLERGSPAEASVESKSYYATALTLVTKEDTIFATSTGDIGRRLVGPRGTGANSGDRVAIFPGCPWPIHLRGSDEGYRILGPCYLHECMTIEQHAEVYKKATSARSGTLDMIPLI